MAAEASNTVKATGLRSTATGDVPDDLKRRYFVDGRGGPGLGFYADATVPTPAFRDRGDRLVTTRIRVPNPTKLRIATGAALGRTPHS